MHQECASNFKGMIVLTERMSLTDIVIQLIPHFLMASTYCTIEPIIIIIMYNNIFHYTAASN